MKKFITFMLVILALSFLVACTADQTEPIVATRPATAVPDLPTPFPSATPLLTPFVPTEAPTATATVMGEDIASFIEQLKTAVTNQDYAAMQAMMSDPIAVGAWRSEWRTYNPEQLFAAFRAATLPAPLAVTFTNMHMSDLAGLLLDQPLTSVFGPDIQVVAALPSTGWGQSTSDEAILLITEQDGHYVWSGFLYTDSRFADAALNTVAAPVGLIYAIFDSGLYQIQLDGQPLQLLDAQTANTPNLRVAPDGRHAAYINDQQQLWLIDIVTGEQQQFAADFTASGYLQWGDKDTLFVGIWLDPNEAEGPNNGHITILDITTGDLQILDEEHLSSSRPALLSDYNWVAFDVFPASQDDILTGRLYHPDSGVQIFDQTTFAGNSGSPIFNPGWSPDPNKIAWLTFTNERHMVQVFDMEAKTADTIFDWDPARFGALVPSPIWSPGGQWLALEVWANGPEGSGLWLLAADGSRRTLIDADGHDPYWANGNLLVYNINGDPRLYDVASQMAFKMDLPEGSWVLGVTNEADLLAQSDTIRVTETATPQAALPDPSELEMTTMTVASPDGRWRATVSQSEPIIGTENEQFYAALTVDNGSTTWQPVAGWRAYGLGHEYPAIYQWSQDNRYLYYTNKIAVDGCVAFLNATDLYRLDLQTGETVELLPSGLTWNLALSPDETSLAYTVFNGQAIVATLRDIATAAEQSVVVAETGPNAQAGNIIWSPDGSQFLLTVAHDACGSNWAHSIIRVNIAGVTAVTLIEEDARQFTILDWADPEEATVRLTDKEGSTWLLDVDSGALSVE